MYVKYTYIIFQLFDASKCEDIQVLTFRFFSELVCAFNIKCLHLHEVDIPMILVSTLAFAIYELRHTFNVGQCSVDLNKYIYKNF